MKLLIEAGALILLIFWCLIAAHYIAVGVKNQLEEQRRKDEEYEKFLRGLRVLDYFEETCGIGIFLKF